MHLTERTGLAVLRQFEPELAHRLSLLALRAGLAPAERARISPRLSVNLAGMELSNPLGLAAGYDKNGEAIRPLLQAGFGFIEIGAVTPRPQHGNPRPRLFRLDDDEAVINRLGFNSQGAAAVARRLVQREPQGVVGINIGPNRDSPDRTGDYVSVLEACGRYVDFATINVSSPNTLGLRDSQAADVLEGILEAVLEQRDRLDDRPRIFLKVAPDISEREVESIAAVALAGRVDGIIATNTTLDRKGLTSSLAGETGGLSGRPLFERSTQVLRQFHRATGGQLPLVGVGGIASGRDAYSKIRAGATALQIYSGLVFHGLSAVAVILDELDMLLKQDGFHSVAEATGADSDSGI